MVNEITIEVSVGGQYREALPAVAIGQGVAYVERSGVEDDKRFTLYDIRTGSTLTYGNTLTEATTMLVESQSAIYASVEEQRDVTTLPLQSEVEAELIELAKIMHVKFIPLNPFVFSVLNCYSVDILRLEHILSRRECYVQELSITENMKNIYGERAVELVGKFLD